jgi:hypothetical protein
VTTGRCKYRADDDLLILMQIDMLGNTELRWPATVMESYRCLSSRPPLPIKLAATGDKVGHGARTRISF